MHLESTIMGVKRSNSQHFGIDVRKACAIGSGEAELEITIYLHLGLEYCLGSTACQVGEHSRNGL